MATETTETKAPVIPASINAEKIKALEAVVAAIRADYAQLKKQYDHHVDMYNKHVMALHK